VVRAAKQQRHRVGSVRDRAAGLGVFVGVLDARHRSRFPTLVWSGAIRLPGLIPHVSPQSSAAAVTASFSSVVAVSMNAEALHSLSSASRMA